MKLKKLTFPAGAALVGFAALTMTAAPGCDEEGPMEEAGEEMDEAAEEMGDEMEDLDDEMEDFDDELEN